MRAPRAVQFLETAGEAVVGLGTVGASVSRARFLLGQWQCLEKAAATGAQHRERAYCHQIVQLKTIKTVAFVTLETALLARGQISEWPSCSIRIQSLPKPTSLSLG